MPNKENMDYLMICSRWHLQNFPGSGACKLDENIWFSLVKMEAKSFKLICWPEYQNPCEIRCPPSSSPAVQRQYTSECVLMHVCMCVCVRVHVWCIPWHLNHERLLLHSVASFITGCCYILSDKGRISVKPYLKDICLELCWTIGKMTNNRFCQILTCILSKC